MNIMEQTKYPLFVGACFSSRFYAPIWFLTYLFFVSFCLGGRKLWVDWREVLVPFGLRERFLKGSFGSFQFEKSFVKGSFGFLPGDWEREILTLVAVQGHLSPSQFFFLFSQFCLPYNGSVGAGSGLSFFSILILWKWKIHNIHPLYLVLMAKPRHSWTMNRGWRYGCALRMFRRSVSPPC